MNQASAAQKKLSRLNRRLQLLCGLYSRIASRLNLDRSYVSRVARGERHSEKVEQALLSEFERIEREQDGR